MGAIPLAGFSRARLRFLASVAGWSKSRIQRPQESAYATVLHLCNRKVRLANPRTYGKARGRCRRRAHPFREDPRSLFDRDAPSRPGMPARRCFGHAIAARLRPSSVRLYLPLPSRRTSPSRAILASLRMTVGRGMPMYWASLYAVIGLPSASPIATPTSSSTSPARDANRRSLSSAMDRARMSSTVRRKRVPTVPSVLTFPLVSYIYPRSL
ncbi:hypothetical protein GO279_00193 [Ralstonia solanacearum]|nr:hypothetical protein [Ralstonia solanacearum]NKA81680.1 hypothetical protein [Ralstonia solanacearum]NKF53038.1 hypothetical protein [Ralstonia solanacearum]NKF59003.1 hypothetical protein [Ralstonia solanacearum]NKF63512.1 hypothetical protein [Ralstonia solanacearum]